MGLCGNAFGNRELMSEVKKSIPGPGQRRGNYFSVLNFISFTAYPQFLLPPSFFFLSRYIVPFSINENWRAITYLSIWWQGQEEPNLEV